MKYLQTKKQNFIFTIVVSIICFALLHQSSALDNAGMAAIFLNWLPLIIGVVTILFYLIATFISEKYAWIVSLLGNLFNIMVLFSAFFNS